MMTVARADALGDILLGDGSVDPKPLEQMRGAIEKHEGTRYAAYQNHDLGHHYLGHLKFMAIGKDWTFQHPPRFMPDTPTEINWRYIFVGWLDPEKGVVVAEKWTKPDENRQPAV